jgi:hypothetical protein
MDKQKLLIGAAGLLVALLLAGVVLAQSSPSFDLSWHVLGGGGGRADSTHYAMNGTVGQAAVGFSDSASYGMQGGYWQNWPGHHVYLPLIVRSHP